MPILYKQIRKPSEKEYGIIIVRKTNIPSNLKFAPFHGLLLGLLLNGIRLFQSRLGNIICL